MAIWTLDDGAGQEVGGPDTATSEGLILTAAGSAHTKGSWTEVTSGLSHACDSFIVEIGYTGSAHVDFLMDIAIGGSGSEQVIVDNLHFVNGGDYGEYPVNTAELPIPIPAGTRVAVRSQASTASVNCRTVFHFLRAAHPHLRKATRCLTIGADTSDTSGVSVTITAGASWTEITASTAEDISWLLICFGHQRRGWSNSAVSMEIAVGGAGSEEVVIQNIPMLINDFPDRLSELWWGPFPLPIPAGSRISGRGAKTAGSETADIILYGFR